MKKLALILAMACFVLTLSFALDEEFKPALAVSGSAKATLNYNLDTTVFALKNAFDTDITFTFLAEKTETKPGEGTYGYIQLKDVKFTFDSDDAKTFYAFADDTTNTRTKYENIGGFTMNEPKVIAKIVSGPIFVQIMDERNTTKTVKAGDFGMPNLSDSKWVNTNFGSLKFESDDGGYLYAGYDSDMIDFTLKVVNTNDNCKPKADLVNQDPTETTADEAPEQIWYIAPSAAVTVSGFTVKAGALFTTLSKPDPKMGFGASVEYSLALTDKINLVPSVGFDMNIVDTSVNTDAKNPMAIGVGVFAKWGGKDKYKPYVTKGTTDDRGMLPDCVSGFKMDGDDVEFQGGAGASVQYVTSSDPDVDPTINVLAQVIEQRGDDGLVPGLGAALSVEISNVSGANDTDMYPVVGFFANYKLGDITPYVRGKYVGENGTVDAQFRLGLGIEVGNVIPNTTLFADWNSYDLMLDENNMGNVSGGVKISF